MSLVQNKRQRAESKKALSLSSEPLAFPALRSAPFLALRRLPFALSIYSFVFLLMFS